MLKRGRWRQVLVVMAGVLLIGAWTLPALAYKPFLEKMCTTLLLDPEKNSKCELCHDFKKELNQAPERKNINAYGKALAARPEMKDMLGKDRDYKFTDEQLDRFMVALKAINDLDTDGDGATNGEELELGTFPADPKSVPSKAELEKYRKENPPKK
ncbi:MAG TPA: thrombospondin type 3 repeat-containing protein [Planctomycetota bacterium]|jgi:hypothetical protein